MIDTLSTEMSDAVMLTSKANSEDEEASQELTSMISGIVQQCSNKIFHVCYCKFEVFKLTFIFR
jgi:hypothetical protein